MRLKPPPRSAPSSAPSRAGARSPAIGRLGEDRAAAHLRGLGFEVLERNVRSADGEIDLIALGADTIVFVEVKTTTVGRGVRGGRDERDERDGSAAVTPLERLGPRQRARLRRLALAWLRETAGTRPHASGVRFDAIGVLLDGRGELLRLEHLEGAW